MSVGLNLFFISLFSIMIFSDIDVLVNLLVINGAVQLALFIFVACIPFLRTKRVSYVDIAWPFGVAIIGLGLFYWLYMLYPPYSPALTIALDQMEY